MGRRGREVEIGVRGRIGRREMERGGSVREGEKEESGKRREKKEAEERKRVASAGGDRVGLQLSLNPPALVGLQLSLNLTRPPAPPTASSFPGS